MLSLTLSFVSSVQDFVRHFRVLLPDRTRPTKSGIREFFRQVHLAPAGYQVGNTMVRTLGMSLFFFFICLSFSFSLSFAIFLSL